MEKTIEIPFGAKDSELKGWEYTIPENMEAEIKDGKIIVKQKESDDEEIKKFIIDCIDELRRANAENADFNGQCSEAIAYLEKQKEQKPIFKKGDKVIWDDEEFNILDVNETEYNVGGYRVPFSRQNELHPIGEKPAEWSEDWREEDIQTRFAFYTYKDDPSVLYLSNVFVEGASRNHGFGTRILRAAEKVAEVIGATTISLKVKQDSPANAWYRKNGYGYVTFEDGYDWLEKNLEYLKPKQTEQKPESCDCSRDEESYTNGIHHVLMNPEAYGLIKLKPAKWSEEDKLHLNNAILVAKKEWGVNSYTARFLESLRDNYKKCNSHWKPSEEQMKEYSYWYKNFIESGFASPSSKAVNVLGELLEQLKKL